MVVRPRFLELASADSSSVVRSQRATMGAVVVVAVGVYPERQFAVIVDACRNEERLYWVFRVKLTEKALDNSMK